MLLGHARTERAERVPLVDVGVPLAPPEEGEPQGLRPVADLDGRYTRRLLNFGRDARIFAPVGEEDGLRQPRPGNHDDARGGRLCTHRSETEGEDSGENNGRSSSH